jgi:hypothetical protein
MQANQQDLQASSITKKVSSVNKSLDREPSVGKIITDLGKKLEEQIRHHQIDNEDPVYQILETTQEVVKLVGQFSDNIPALVSDAMIDSADSIEQRVVLAVRQNIKPSRTLPIFPSPRSLQYWLAGSLTATLGTLLICGFTAKLLYENKEQIAWATSNEGQLARQIVEANKGRLNERCLKTARNLKEKIVIDGVDRHKVCLVALP